MTSLNSTLGAVLAGGRSSRMGQDKADVLVRDHTMLEMVGAALGKVVERTVVLGHDRDGWECWADSVHVQGPLAGIATALERTDTDHVLLVAVDHPFVAVHTLENLVTLTDGLPVVPVDEHGVRQVTCAVYPTGIADVAREEASNGGSIQSLLDRVSFRPVSPEDWRSWGEDGRSWYSVDDRDTLAQGLSIFATN